MKIMKMLKFTGLIAIVFSVVIGCTSTSEDAGSEQAAKDAIAAAKDAYARADAMGAAWRDTNKMIKDAEKLLSEGKYDEATALANKAREQAEDAIAQRQFEDQRTAHMFTSAAPVTTPSAGQYAVVRGDNLWNISAKPDIYNNPYQWPLIYKANSNKIKDADLIYPGQVFDINSNPSAAESDAAVRHARTRGSWSLGAVEDSDRAYLAR